MSGPNQLPYRSWPGSQRSEAGPLSFGLSLVADAATEVDARIWRGSWPTGVVGQTPCRVPGMAGALRGPMSSRRRLLSGRRVDGQARCPGDVEQAFGRDIRCVPGECIEGFDLGEHRAYPSRLGSRVKPAAARRGVPDEVVRPLTPATSRRPGRSGRGQAASGFPARAG